MCHDQAAHMDQLVVGCHVGVDRCLSSNISIVQVLEVQRGLTGAEANTLKDIKRLLVSALTPTYSGQRWLTSDVNVWIHFSTQVSCELFICLLPVALRTPRTDCSSLAIWRHPPIFAAVFAPMSSAGDELPTSNQGWTRELKLIGSARHSKPQKYTKGFKCSTSVLALTRPLMLPKGSLALSLLSFSACSEGGNPKLVHYTLPI